MKRAGFTLLLAALSIAACNKKAPPQPDQKDIWPLSVGNEWHYSVTKYTADGASTVGGDFTLIIDASKDLNGKSWYGTAGTNSFYRNDANSVKETDSTGSYEKLFVKSVHDPETILTEPATYMVGSNSYTGTLTRIAYPDGTQLDGYTCMKVEDNYTDANNKLGLRIVRYYSLDKGPICYMFYSNPENPNSDSVYRSMKYMVTQMTVK